MTNQAYEATNSDVGKLISSVEKLAITAKEYKSLTVTLSVIDVLKIIGEVRRLDGRNANLNSTLESWATDRAESAQRISELESAPNGMMQLSNELAEMKRKCVDVPDGWELAPSRPTQRMLAAGYQAYMKGPHNGRFYRTYQAMLSAVGTVEGSE